MAQAIYYHATLCLRALLIVNKDEKREGIKVEIGLGDKQIPIGTKKKLALVHFLGQNK